MSTRSDSLVRRRERLVASSTAQRARLVADCEPLGRAAATLDRIVGPIRRHPVIATLAVTGVALLGSRKVFDLASRAVTIYMLLRRR
ncbi:MAG TPA: hypothetical protein VEU32_21920 [Burkholderiales bacterium]|nr:hypothetical protein [Burkholderiales bacterium]